MKIHRIAKNALVTFAVYSAFQLGQVNYVWAEDTFIQRVKNSVIEKARPLYALDEKIVNTIKYAESLGDIEVNESLDPINQNILYNESAQKILDLNKKLKQKLAEEKENNEKIELLWSLHAEKLNPLYEWYNNELRIHMNEERVASNAYWLILLTLSLGCDELIFNPQAETDQVRDLYTALGLNFQVGKEKKDYLKELETTLMSASSEKIKKAIKHLENLGYEHTSEDTTYFSEFLENSKRTISSIEDSNEQLIKSNDFRSRIELILAQRRKKAVDKLYASAEKYLNKKYSTVPKLKELDAKKKVLLEEKSQLDLQKHQLQTSWIDSLNKELCDIKEKELIRYSYKLLLFIDENDNLLLENHEKRYLMESLGIQSESFDESEVKRNLLNLDILTIRNKIIPTLIKYDCPFTETDKKNWAEFLKILKII